MNFTVNSNHEFENSDVVLNNVFEIKNHGKPELKNFINPVDDPVLPVIHILFYILMYITYPIFEYLDNQTLRFFNWIKQKIWNRLKTQIQVEQEPTFQQQTEENATPELNRREIHEDQEVESSQDKGKLVQGNVESEQQEELQTTNLEQKIEEKPKPDARKPKPRSMRNTGTFISI